MRGARAGHAKTDEVRQERELGGRMPYGGWREKAREAGSGESALSGAGRAVLLSFGGSRYRHAARRRGRSPARGPASPGTAERAKPGQEIVSASNLVRRHRDGRASNANRKDVPWTRRFSPPPPPPPSPSPSPSRRHLARAADGLPRSCRSGLPGGRLERGLQAGDNQGRVPRRRWHGGDLRGAREPPSDARHPILRNPAAQPLIARPARRLRDDRRPTRGLRSFAAGAGVNRRRRPRGSSLPRRFSPQFPRCSFSPPSRCRRRSSGSRRDLLPRPGRLGRETSAPARAGEPPVRSRAIVSAAPPAGRGSTAAARDRGDRRRPARTSPSRGRRGASRPPHCLF